MKKEGISLEVVDLRTVQPLDIEQSSLLLKNRSRSCSSRSSKTSWYCTNVVAEINDRAILNLEAPVVRVAAADTVFPFSQAESVWLPNHKDIVEAVNKVMNF